MALKLTKRNLDALPAGTASGTWYADSETRGFFVVSYASGQKIFFVRYRTPNGARRVVRVGRYGQITVEQARAKAGDLFAEGDPADRRKRAREMPTFGKWSELYLQRIRGRKKYPRSDERFLPMAAARWGTKPLDTITREDVIAFHQSLKETPTQANRWLASVRSCLSEAVRSEKITSNPARGIPHFRENPPRARVLSNDELDRALKALRLEEDTHGAAGLRLLVETGARGAEVLRARWEDVDLDAGTWRMPDTKAGKPQVVPLARSTVAMLRRLPRVGPWVIPGRDPENARGDLRGPWDRLKERAGISGVTIHDIRRTYGLHVAKTAGLHVASKLLRHSDIRVTERVYAPLGLEDLRVTVERRQADVVKLERRRTKRPRG